jgi:uncharacterized protein (DUF362 family)
MNKVPVSIVRCKDYDEARVEAAVRKAVDLLPEIGRAITPELDVLLKVNVTAIREPQLAVSTHPTVAKACARIIKEMGASVKIGESGGDSGWPAWRKIRAIVFEKLKCRMKGMTFGQLQEFYDKVMSITSLQDMQKLSVSGMKKALVTFEDIGADTEIDFYNVAGIRAAAQEAGIELVYPDLEPIRNIVPPNVMYISQVPVWESVFRADRIISLTKFKTHDCTVLTGAIKNFFGIIPTTLRSTYHISSNFAAMMPQMLVDVYSAISPPPFAITDAVVGMEGHGPAWGTPRTMGCIMASCDCVAHDAVMAAMVGLNPMKVPTVRVAHESGLGQGLLENIEVRGVQVEEVCLPDWDLYKDNNTLRE